MLGPLGRGALHLNQHVGPRGKPTPIILLSEHTIKLPFKHCCLVAQLQPSSEKLPFAVYGDYSPDSQVASSEKL